MLNRILTYAFLVLVLLSPTAVAQSTSDYLVLQDIGSYVLDKPEKKFPGIAPMGGPEIYNNSPGVVGPAGHFLADHVDRTYKVMYFGGAGMPSPTVFVTQHIGGDSDKWLLHEMEMDFRNYYGNPGKTYGPRVIDGQTVMEDTVGGIDYRWMSGNNVIDIHYTDLEMEKPEPLAVVQAYLAKFPSTLPAITLQELRGAANKTVWIKDEINRRLWLCDKWFMQLQLKKAEEKDVYREAVKSMNIFLDYREKYFSSLFSNLKAAPEKELLAQFLAQNNGSGIRTKLKEYKDWWAGNRNKAISL